MYLIFKNGLTIKINELIDDPSNLYISPKNYVGIPQTKRFFKIEISEEQDRKNLKTRTFFDP